MAARKRAAAARHTQEELASRACAALQQHAKLICEQQSTLSLKGVRRLLEEKLGLEGGSLDPLKATIAKEVDVILARQVEPRVSLLDLPEEVLGMVLRQLDHDSLFQAAHSCRAFRNAGAGESLWQELCLRHGWAQQQQQQPQQQQQQQPQQQPQQPEQQPQQRQQASPAAGGSAPAWRQLYRQRYHESCHECFQPCQRTTLTFAPLWLRLCQGCSREKAQPSAAHRLISKTQAKWEYCLKDADLEGLPYALDANPIEPNFNAMRLYRRPEVAAAAVRRWGSQKAAEGERRRRLAR